MFDFTMDESVSKIPSEKNYMTKFSLMGSGFPVSENTHEKNSTTILSVSRSKTLLNLACLYQKACDAEEQTIKANQDEILCWYSYIVEFDNQLKNIMKNDKVGEKKAKGRIYDFITTQLGTKRKKNL